jgi:hypothetical protein
MALNMNDKKYLSAQILPEVSLNITSTGITIHAEERLSTPRFLQFDQSGKCSSCKSTEAEIDFVVTKEGVTVYCSRIKGSRFVPFDYVRDLPGFTFFKIKNKGRVFNVDHGFSPCEEVAVPKKKLKQEKPQPATAHPSVDKQPDLLEGLAAVAAFAGLLQGKAANPPATLPSAIPEEQPQQEKSEAMPVDESMDEVASNFIQSLHAATTGLPMPENEKMEENEAIASIMPKET